MKVKLKSGFTLVELLIVIALIAILSVAVLATINPIEQANKAKDSTVQNDAAEVLNAYERYYATKQSYPWMEYADTTAITVDDARVFRSDAAGFGICYADKTTATSTTTGTCNTSGSNLGELIVTDELKPSFVGKSEFQNVTTNAQEGLWTVKTAGSGGGIYVCYIPKAKANRQITEKLYCIDNTDTDDPTMTKVDEDPNDTCVALAVSATGWSTPTLNGTVGMFRCVPE